MLPVSKLLFFTLSRSLLVITAACLSLSLCAQQSNPKPAAAGDTPVDAGPLATGLSGDLSKHDILKALRLVSNWQLERLHSQPETDWTYAALYAGFMALPPQVGGNRYRKAMLKIAEENQWKPGPRPLHADDQAISQTYLELYFLKHNEKRILPTKEHMDAAMALPDNPEKPLWWWCDALFMAPPVLADLYTATNDAKYLNYMDREWTVTSDLLYDPHANLFTRDASFLNGHEKNGEKIFWARGNGWVMAGLVRVLERLPSDSPLRAKYAKQLQEMAAAMVALQGGDGMWRPGLLDQANYPLPETSGTAFITYAIAYGVNNGILSPETYGPIVRHAWSGMLKHVYADGRLGCIQPVAAAPGVFGLTSSYVYGVGGFMLAGSEIYKMAH